MIPPAPSPPRPDREAALVALAREAPVERREALLDMACGGDGALRARVEAALGMGQRPADETVGAGPEGGATDYATLGTTLADLVPDEVEGSLIGR